MRRGRRVAASVVLASVCSGLSGCSVPVGSWLAVTLDGDGAVLVLVEHCDGYLDAIELYDVAGSDKKPNAVDVYFTEPMETDTTVSLAQSTKRVAVDPEGVVLEPDVTYAVRGYTDDDDWHAPGPRFTVADLERLSPGTVLAETPDGDPDVGVSEEEFRSDACLGT